MRPHERTGPVLAGLAACLMLVALFQSAALSEIDSSTNAAASLTNLVSDATAAQLQAMIQLQTQQEATLKALELTRHEIATSLAASLSNNMTHLNAMGEMLAQQRAQDMKILRDSNRLLLAIVVGLTGLLLLSIVFLNVTSIRAINRLSTVFQASALLPPGDSAPAGGSRQLLLFPGEEGQRQLGSALLQLQSRIQALESVAARARPKNDIEKPGEASAPATAAQGSNA